MVDRRKRFCLPPGTSGSGRLQCIDAAFSEKHDLLAVRCYRADVGYSLELALLSGGAPREVRWLGTLGQRGFGQAGAELPCCLMMHGDYLCVGMRANAEDPTIRIYDLAQLRVAGEGLLCHVLALKLCCSDLRCSEYYCAHHSVLCGSADGGCAGAAP